MPRIFRQVEPHFDVVQAIVDSIRLPRLNGKTIPLKEPVRMLTGRETHSADVFLYDDFVKASQKEILTKAMSVIFGSDHSPAQICLGTTFSNPVAAAAYDLTNSLDDEIWASR